MKLQFKIILILALLVMIVSPVISQKNYVIGNDTIVGYTKHENRIIAIIFQDRNKLEELNFDNNQLLFEYQTTKLKLEDNMKQFSIKDSINNININKLNIKLTKETKSKNTWKTIGQGGLVVSTILFIVTLLK